ncbi:MAG: glycosyltransferase family 2 protein [Caldilineaceae bacterium]|nr:glycosyltransferase family 2 protein [Caldilineaceae bacterium]
MPFLIYLLQFIYTTGVIGLAIFGLNALWLTWCSRSYYTTTAIADRLNPPRKDIPKYALLDQSASTDDWPYVTIQLPIYNERHVVERLIDACAAMQYPRARLQIQVLDDSTDLTSLLVQRRVQQLQECGYHIEHIQRPDRVGYKAGALAHAFAAATGEFIAIFDADFEPPADFLLQTLPHFQQSESIGFVQARWGHLNYEYSPITRSQALALDGHFLIEQAGRQSAGYAFGFNGSAGVWRRACIEDAKVGGWHIDTLCEDLDLSYRAQLAGWQPQFLNHIVAPAEIPPQLSGFKRQQFRWAKGSIQTLLKCAPHIWHSSWSAAQKVQGFIHLGSYLLHPLLLVLLLISLPLTLLDVHPLWPLAYLSVASVGPPLLYAVAQRRLRPAHWLRRWSYICVLTLLGFGLCLSNTIAVAQALLGRSGQFLRTPKFHVQSNQDRWQNSVYRLPLEPIFFGELSLFLYAAVTAFIAAASGRWWTALFVLFYVGGFGLMTGVELWQSKPSLPHFFVKSKARLYN